MKLIISFLSKNKGIGALLLTLIFLLFFYFFPKFHQGFYHEFIFVILRNALDYTVGLLPFPLIYLILLITPVISWLQSKKYKTGHEKALLLPANLSGWVFAWFMWFWGFHYVGSSPFIEHQARAMSQEELYVFGQKTTSVLRQYSDSCYSERPELPFEEIQDAVEVFLQNRNYTCSGNPRFFEVGLNGFMRRNGVAGIYLPFSGQAHVDRSFLNASRTFILAHELAHAYGISAESDADFVAFMALKESKIEELQFAAHFELLRSIRSQLHFMQDSLRIALDSLQNQPTLDLLRRTKANALLYPEYFPGLQEKMNDRYLKMMGVEEGVKNYDHYIDMVWSLEAQHE